MKLIHRLKATWRSMPLWAKLADIMLYLIIISIIIHRLIK